MTSLSRDDVAKLAGLARIEMSDEELVALSNEFTVILDAVARVQEVAGADVPATSSIATSKCFSPRCSYSITYTS